MSSKLFTRFAVILISVFLLFAALGIGLLTRHDLDGARAELSARVGNFAARASGAIETYGGARIEPGLAHDLIAALAADPGVTCAELRDETSGALIAAHPRSLGCKADADLPGDDMVLFVSPDAPAVLTVRISDDAQMRATSVRRSWLLLIVAVAFLVAVGSALIGFRMTVSGRLSKMLEAIQRNIDSGERLSIENSGSDEISELITAFNTMLEREQTREQQLYTAREALREINTTLEERIAHRTVEIEKGAASLRALIEHHSSAVFVECDGHIVFVNPAALEQESGARETELIGRPVLDLFVAECQSMIEAALIRASSSNDSVRIDDITRQRVDGSCYDAEVSCATVIWDGLSAHLIEIRDISEYKQTELALSLARERAEQAAAASETAMLERSALLGKMSLTIHTPLRAIAKVLDALDTEKPSATFAPRIESARQTSATLIELLDRTLEFSRIETQGLALNASAFDLRGVLNDVVERFAHAARAKGLRFALLVDGITPQRLRGDCDRLSEVISYLIDNAMASTDSGGIEVRVSAIESSSQGNWCRLRFAVSDSGIGIDPAEQCHVFEPFLLATADREHCGGANLGLAISRRLVLAMGGEIGVIGAPDAGATFWFEIPFQLIGREASLGSHLISLGIGDRFPHSTDEPQVLLVGGSLVDQQIIVQMLHTIGFRSVVASSADDVLRLIGDLAIDILLLDRVGQASDGLLLARRVRTFEAHHQRQPIPIVSLTDAILNVDRDAGRAAGIDDWLAKPFPQAALDRVLHHWQGRIGVTANSPRRERHAG